MQVNLPGLQDQLKSREHQAVLEDRAAPEDPGARVVREDREVQEGPGAQEDLRHHVLEKQRRQPNPQKNRELPEVQADREVPADQGDPVAREDRVVQVAPGVPGEKQHLALDKQRNQPSQQRNQERRAVPEVPVGLVAPEALEAQEVLEVPVDREVPEVLEVRLVQEDPVVRQDPQRNLQELQPKRPSQLHTHLGSQMAPEDQEDRGDQEDPVDQEAREDLVGQEAREVTEQNSCICFIYHVILIKLGHTSMRIAQI